jgi:hypothetical protein
MYRKIYAILTSPTVYGMQQGVMPNSFGAMWGMVLEKLSE